MNSPHNIFEHHYLDVREKEKRVYTDDQVKKLPFISPNTAQKHEWKLRSKTAARFLKYMSNRRFENVLDLGCGNGWFTHQLAKNNTNAVITGGDINRTELDQAARCFKNPNITFEYIDIFDFHPNNKYDLITINAAIQYFPNIKELLTAIVPLLTQKGEFHVLDTPIYDSTTEANLAQQRSSDYYIKMGVPEMVNSYYHHTWNDFKNFETLYLPKKNKLIQKIRKDSPFPWLYLTNR